MLHTIHVGPSPRAQITPRDTPPLSRYLILLPQVTVAPIFYGFSNAVQPQVLDPKVHVSKPENEASGRKEGRSVRRPEGGATGGSVLFTPGATSEKPDAGRGPGEDQGMDLMGLFSWLPLCKRTD